ncbi:DgyrCDS2360 [Dimorphilus gyrociliatus]|uniref:NTF2-related export protein n=1 Tax=Dimorphilus gyrociliatus TaxID=2664684 RepID=A0A7I8VAA9_9ANNE|nr:DgyrCDS2360 [Dimorphilus gyrociliatus]
MSLEASIITSETADETGLKFVELFYEAMDRQRHNLNKFFLPMSEMVWSGEKVTGDNISKYFEKFPTSKHNVECVDAQPITCAAERSGKPSTIVSVSGTVSFNDDKLKLFSSQFILIAENNTWKVLNSSIRLFD